MKTIVSERGQITVPKQIRDRLALVPGTELEIELGRGGFVARKRVAVSPWRAAIGLLRRPGATDKLVNAMRGRVDVPGR
jgi:antitoxin PrlF